MTPRATRATLAGRAYLDLQNLARRTGRLTDELHQIYALEGFLERMATSPYADRLVLKGGVLLAAYDVRRPTRDVDLQGHRMANEADDVRRMVCAIAARRIPDGLTFDVDKAGAETIRDGDAYSGVRVTLTGQLAVARLSLHVDVSVGDPIRPPPTTVTLPRLLHGQITLTGYPLSMVYAEKLVTAVDRADANTRWRDFADVYLLARRHDIAGSELIAAVLEVANHRGVQLAPLRSVLDGYPAAAQPRWAAWRRKQNLVDQLPQEFAVVIDQVTALADPVLTGSVHRKTWVASDGSWNQSSFG